MSSPDPFGREAKITALPGGLLDFLGIKNRGRYPDTISPIIAPTLNLWDLYACYQYEEQNVTVASDGSLSSYIAYTVPQGETWYVFTWSARTVPLTAGNNAELVNEINPAGVVARTIVGRGNGPVTGAAAANQTAYAYNERPIWARPGDQLRFRPVTHLGTYNVDVSIRFVRLGL